MDKPLPGGYWWDMAKDYRGPGPLAHYLGARIAGEAPQRVPPSLVPFWARLGYVRDRGVKRGARHAAAWDRIMGRNKTLKRWIYSDAGLRAPRLWPKAIEDELYEQGIYVAPVDFAAACFAGKNRIASRYAKWRGMPELTAAAHGWCIEPEEEQEARYAVRALAQHLPFLVYVYRPDFANVPLPQEGGGLIKRLVARRNFMQDPMGQSSAEVARAINVQVWTPDMLAALPRLPWAACTKNVPEERSLVEAGAGGWRPLASVRP